MINWKLNKFERQNCSLIKDLLHFYSITDLLIIDNLTHFHMY
jgi:hypothetical protein